MAIDEQNLLSEVNNFTADPTARIYHPISTEHREIRILCLHLGSWLDDLWCDLEAVSLDALLPVQYEALSYVWGAATAGKKIFIDGIVLSITDNFAAALRRLRLAKDIRVLWVDAICINQSNLVERAQQVGIMGDVYARAIQVIAWLGEGSSDPVATSDITAGPFGTEIYSELDLALENTAPSWWDRVWVVQEAVLAREIVVHFGCFRSTWNTFCHDLLQIERGRKSFISVASPHSTTATREAIIVRCRAPRQLRSQYRSQRCFERVVSYTNKASSSDPRDKVYSILSMLHPRYLEALTPDYLISPEALFVQATQAAIEIEENLAVLQLVGFPHPPNLPTWALDFTRASGVNIVESYGFGGLLHEVHIGVPANSRPPSLPALGGYPDSLITTGVLFDTITAVGSGSAENSDPEKTHNLADMLRMALQSLPLLPGYYGFRKDARQRSSKMRAHLQRRLDSFIDGSRWTQDLLPLLTETSNLWYEILDVPKSIRRNLERVADDILRFLQYACAAALERDAVAFSTSNDFMELAPDNLQEGDVVVLLRGSKLPVILRPQEQGTRLSFCGLAFVHGIMFGELMEMCSEEDFKRGSSSWCETLCDGQKHVGYGVSQLHMKHETCFNADCVARCATSGVIETFSIQQFCGGTLTTPQPSTYNTSSSYSYSVVPLDNAHSADLQQLAGFRNGQRHLQPITAADPDLKRRECHSPRLSQSTLAWKRGPTNYDMLALAERIQTLPAELFDEIYELTFTADVKEVVLDKDFKPLAQLQVDTKSREHFAEQYYANTTFVIQTESMTGVEWFQALEENDIKTLRAVKLEQDYVHYTHDEYDLWDAFCELSNFIGQVEGIDSVDAADQHGFAYFDIYKISMWHKLPDGTEEEVWWTPNNFLDIDSVMRVLPFISHHGR